VDQSPALLVDKMGHHGEGPFDHRNLRIELSPEEVMEFSPRREAYDCAKLLPGGGRQPLG